MTNLLAVVIESCDRRDSIAWLKVGRTRLASSIWEGMKAGARATVRIDAEDVVICLGHPGRISARNVLPGHVRGTRFVDGGVRVALDVGFPLTALLTRTACKELGIRKGTAIFAMVKASVIAPEEPVAPVYRVALVGARGLLSPERIDFLRAVSRTRSLTAAARELGIMYRTAWLWARDANRTWGTPVVAPRHGGKGGGGSALTPQGLSLLRLAERLERGGGPGRSSRAQHQG